jgi:hypothetical protein
MRKLKLTAAQRVTAKKPNLLRTNLTLSPPVPLASCATYPVPAYYL